MDYAPEYYSQAQLDELDRLTARWIADHMAPGQDLQKTVANSSLLRLNHFVITGDPVGRRTICSGFNSF